MIPRMMQKYKEEIVPRLSSKFGYKNVMQVPRVEKIMVNIGVNEAKQDIKFMNISMEELGIITGQRPLMRRAKKSVAGFKVREGMPVAAMVVA